MKKPARIPAIKMIKVKSSNIEAIGYDARRFQLFVEFKATDRSKGITFAYEDVSPAEHAALMKVFLSSIRAAKKGCLYESEPAKESNGWISVDDKLPRIGERVLIYTTQALEAVMYESKKFNRFGSGIDYATHWMPLPAPPIT